MMSVGSAEATRNDELTPLPACSMVVKAVASDQLPETVAGLAGSPAVAVQPELEEGGRQKRGTEGGSLDEYAGVPKRSRKDGSNDGWARTCGGRADSVGVGTGVETVPEDASGKCGCAGLAALQIALSHLAFMTIAALRRADGDDTKACWCKYSGTCAHWSKHFSDPAYATRDVGKRLGLVIRWLWLFSGKGAAEQVVAALAPFFRHPGSAQRLTAITAMGCLGTLAVPFASQIAARLCVEVERHACIRQGAAKALRKIHTGQSSYWHEREKTNQPGLARLPMVVSEVVVRRLVRVLRNPPDRDKRARHFVLSAVLDALGGFGTHAAPHVEVFMDSPWHLDAEIALKDLAPHLGPFASAIAARLLAPGPGPAPQEGEEMEDVPEGGPQPAQADGEEERQEEGEEDEGEDEDDDGGEDETTQEDEEEQEGVDEEEDDDVVEIRKRERRMRELAVTTLGLLGAHGAAFTDQIFDACSGRFGPDDHLFLFNATERALKQLADHLEPYVGSIAARLGRYEVKSGRTSPRNPFQRVLAALTLTNLGARCCMPVLGELFEVWHDIRAFAVPSRGSNHVALECWRSVKERKELLEICAHTAERLSCRLCDLAGASECGPFAGLVAEGLAHYDPEARKRAMHTLGHLGAHGAPFAGAILDACAGATSLDDPRSRSTKNWSIPADPTRYRSPFCGPWPPDLVRDRRRSTWAWSEVEDLVCIASDALGRLAGIECLGETLHDSSGCAAFGMYRPERRHTATLSNHLCPFAADIAGRLTHRTPHVRRLAVQTLGHLGAAGAPFAIRIVEACAKEKKRLREETGNENEEEQTGTQNEKQNEMKDDQDDRRKEDVYSHLSLLDFAFEAMEALRPHIVGPFGAEFEGFSAWSPELMDRLRAYNSGIMDLLRYLKPKANRQLFFLVQWALNLKGIGKWGWLREDMCKHRSVEEETEDEENEEDIEADEGDDEEHTTEDEDEEVEEEADEREEDALHI